MKHQLQTIREALNLALNSLLSEATKYEHPLIKQALAALSELERLAGEPVAWVHWLHGPVRVFMSKDEATLELDRLNREYPVDVGARQMRPLVFGDAAPPAQQPQYEAGDMASAHNDGFRAGVASVAQQPQEPEMTPAFRSSNAYTVGFQDGKAQALAQQPQAVPPANCRQRLKHDGKAYPRSSCAACGEFSPKWKECDAAMAQGEKP